MSVMQIGPIDGRGIKVNERCDRCGARVASRVDETVTVSGCCVPGPPPPPMTYQADTVVFVPGQFSAAELCEQRDKAERQLNKFRPGFYQMERKLKRVAEALEGLS